MDIKNYDRLKSNQHLLFSSILLFNNSQTILKQLTNNLKILYDSQL